MRFGIAAVALAAAALAIACGGDDDDDPTPTNTTDAGSTATQPAEATTAAPGETTTSEPSETETPEPIVLEPTFECESPIGVLEARANDGQEEVEFSERVYEVTEREGDPVLAVGAPFDAVLRVEVVIWPEAVEELDVPIAEAFQGRIICAVGTVDNVGGVRTIFVESADQLTVVAE